jgi:acyl transferase domain-containing protein/3-hydroxymyristoyl/3-hydroxydecanoyl-(acyl carrier protein) dehydratase
MKPIAIVGMGGIFPGARDLDDFWENVLLGRSASRDIPPHRWAIPIEEAYHPGDIKPDRAYSRRGCLIDDEVLQALSLRYLADLPAWCRRDLDPLYLITLCASLMAFRDAATEGLSLSRTGVILGNIALPTDGSSALSWEILGRTMEEKVCGESHEGRKTDPLNACVTGLPAGLVARALGLGGGSFTLDAACASSLYAVKLALDELTSGRCDAMLCGGVSRADCLYTQMGFSQLKALSPDGLCTPFDEKGSGLVIGEGAGVIMLKRLDDALSSGDHIYALIRGAGLANDREGNLLAPATEGQLRSMRSAYEQAGWSPSDVDLIECHATGTPVGDAVEIASLKELWKGCSWKKGQCVVGSVKSNIGHLLTGAGAAGIIKVLQALREEILPPTAHFSRASASLSLDRSPFRVLAHGEPWPRRKEGISRKAAVSAFGFGGINGHVLLEEWTGQVRSRRAPSKIPARQGKSVPLAIVGLGAHFGPWDSLTTLSEHFFGGRDSDAAPRPKKGWYGLEESAWFRALQGDRPFFEGFGIEDLQVPIGQFRIPPKELQEMLPQQLLMLLVAKMALDDAGEPDRNHVRSGAFIGIAFDFNTTNFHCRWSIAREAKKWAQKLGRTLDDEELGKWIAALRDSCSPPLTANRTMGALGSIVASRIAREFHFGGPSFAISSEESSGLRALEAAARRLQAGDINFALVGAVDCAGDIRALITRRSLAGRERFDARTPHSGSSPSLPFGEGAAALVLKRLSDAEKEGNRIYGIIRGLGAASGGDLASLSPGSWACEKALERAYLDGAAGRESIDFIELDGDATGMENSEGEALAHFFACRGEKSPLIAGRISSVLGNAGAAGPLAAVIRASLSLYHHWLTGNGENGDFLPGRLLLSDASRSAPWLRNRAQGPRRAAISSMSIDGSCLHAVIEGYENKHPVTPRQSAHFGEALFAIRSASLSSLREEIKKLRSLAAESAAEPSRLARTWHESRPQRGSKVAMAFLARSQDMLLKETDQALAFLEEHPDKTLIGRDRLFLPELPPDSVFYTPGQLAKKGTIAFVFPGSGNYFPGMGKEICSIFPGVLENQDRENGFLRDQILPQYFWHKESLREEKDNHRVLMVGQVAYCTLLCDLLRTFKISPDAVIGYSLGEMAGLFSLRAWKDRDGMLERMQSSRLFTDDLAGHCRAARKWWRLPARETVDWALGVVDMPADRIIEALKGRSRVYLLIVNTPHDCVIGGTRKALEKLVADLGCTFFPLEGVTTVHCEVVKAVAREYRDFHLFPVTAPAGVTFYSTGWGRSYELSRERAADAILAQAVDTLDFPRVIKAAYQDGVRLFVETGPGASCSRMIGSILADLPHGARSASSVDLRESTSLLRLLAFLVAEGVPLSLAPLYGGESLRAETPIREESPGGRITIPTGGGPFRIPGLPEKKPPVRPTPDLPKKEKHGISPPAPSPLHAAAGGPAPSSVPCSGITLEPVMRHFEALQGLKLRAHEAYLTFTRSVTESLSRNLAFQMELLDLASSSGLDLPSLAGDRIAQRAVAFLDNPESLSSGSRDAAPAQTMAVALDRPDCMEFATGSIAKVLGPSYAVIDSFPTRVRLPDEPLMLVDRILRIEGEPLSLSRGTVVTEHDIHNGAWYLDGNRIPTCIAVEAGQADLFLSGYLGIDMKTEGHAVYRLLDAEVTFHRPLPGPGDTIHYEIHIDHFFTQGTTWLFRFRFDSTVKGSPLLTMRNGCAGFFTAGELESGKGIIHTELDRRPVPGKRPPDWENLVPMTIEAYSDSQLEEIRKGNLEGAFGALFAGLAVQKPLTIPGGLMKLVHRILHLDPAGGRFGLGTIYGEADIHRDDWFLTCHFCDDNVMPGTLMYECCFHTLRIFLLRMGWVAEAGKAVWEPVAGVKSRLKCRGQVIESTKRAVYEISIKEIGYNPSPYAIADALMYADGKPVVEIIDMSVQLAGVTRGALEGLWKSRREPVPGGAGSVKPALYDNDTILAFALGKPSEAFGEPYRIFDEKRIIARLPGPPYKFLDRITAIRAEAWKLVEGGTIEAQYDLTPDEWYFASNRQPAMPFAILLEVALQPCGWFAAYMGSALTSEQDLSFRNLGGEAVLYHAVTGGEGLLTTSVKATRISSSGGMIIQHFDFQVSSPLHIIYRGSTYFGFFSKEALAQQIGIRDAQRYSPSAMEEREGKSFVYPSGAPFPDERLTMIDRIDLLAPHGGPHGLGYIRGTMAVDPSSWFFKAHFYQDPVIPGSLGLESFVQLLKVFARERWGDAGGDRHVLSPVEGYRHGWTYRGQVIPGDSLVTVDACITSIDDNDHVLIAEGYLSVDRRVIYHMKDFSLRL